MTEFFICKCHKIILHNNCLDIYQDDKLAASISPTCGVYINIPTKGEVFKPYSLSLLIKILKTLGCMEKDVRSTVISKLTGLPNIDI